MVDPTGWSVHDTESNWSNGSYYFDIQAPKNMNMNEEWFGIVALSAMRKNSASISACRGRRIMCSGNYGVIRSRYRRRIRRER